MFEPIFTPGSALFIIWRWPRHGGKETIAAGTHRAMTGAWAELQDSYPEDELTFQSRARVLLRRPPLVRRDPPSG